MKSLLISSSHLVSLLAGKSMKKCYDGTLSNKFLAVRLLVEDNALVILIVIASCVGYPSRDILCISKHVWKFGRISLICAGLYFPLHCSLQCPEGSCSYLLLEISFYWNFESNCFTVFKLPVLVLRNLKPFCSLILRMLYILPSRSLS